MKKIWNDLSLGIAAAWYDVSHSILHPIQNLKVTFGLAKGETLEGIIERIRMERVNSSKETPGENSSNDP